MREDLIKYVTLALNKNDTDTLLNMLLNIGIAVCDEHGNTICIEEITDMLIGAWCRLASSGLEMKSDIAKIISVREAGRVFEIMQELSKQKSIEIACQ